ncbi:MULTISPECIES: rhodanese-like domain-containing protein [unclassified Leucobacter]|uniref:rhodanese-like domain-containing protein n=1 Tax=unclassified Leucobacter TaxID=2621730 RepID=UPI00165DA0F6|nr:MULTISPECIES: rhodanese-like domain-containing protein [unclassified Leucobacter]MBC9928705.1 rhodanese-like domain-containing protein [Leucobacter sp. cx-169]
MEKHMSVFFDVRTPEEWANGHLEGAHPLDFNSGDVAAAIPSLDPCGEYLVYCRSGNRSGQAMTLMQQAGIDNVTNLGSLEEAAEITGLKVVTDSVHLQNRADETTGS